MNIQGGKKSVALTVHVHQVRLDLVDLVIGIDDMLVIGQT